MRLLVPGPADAISGGHLYNREMARRAAAHGARIDIEYLPATLPAGAQALRRSLERAVPDEVLIDSLAVAWLGRWAAPAAHPAWIAIAHQPPGGLDGSPAHLRLRRAADLAGYGRVDGIIATGRTVAEELAAAGVAPSRIRIVNPGRALVARPDTELPELRRGRRIALLCAANWLPRKGLVALLGAVGRLPDELVTVHLAGDEHADREHRRRVRRVLGHPALSGRVVVHGTVSPSRMAVLYAAADVFALPSRDEPYGMVYTEAMASGLPVIGWRSGNLPHLCSDGREGLLVPTGDGAGLAAAIRALAEDQTLRERLGRAAAQRAAALPDWDAAAAAFVSAALSLSLGTRPGSGARNDPR